MIRRSVMVAAVGTVMGLAGFAVAAETFEVDTVHSTVLFRIKHMNVSWFYGRFTDITGTLMVDTKKPEASTIEIKVKTDSIQTDNEKRNAHLKSPDFFAAKQYPELTFKSTSAKSVGDGAIEMKGDLTCHGVTKPLTVTLQKVGEAKDPRGGVRAGYETKFNIKRSDFGMDFMPGGLGDDIEIIVSLEGVKK